MLASIPRSTTWETLHTSRNEAAIVTLMTGLESSLDEVRHKCVKALVARPEESACRAVISGWDHYEEADLEFLRGKAQHFVECCTQMLSGGTLSEKRAALAAIADLDLGDAMSVLLELVVDPRHALSSQATKCLHSMCDRWGQLARDGKDVPSVRSRMLEKLHSQIVMFFEHKNTNIIDAWLSLAHWDDSAQRGLISDPRLDAYRSVLKRLSESDHPAILQLLGGYLGRTATPKRVLEIVTERVNPELAIEIARLHDASTLQGVLRHLKQLPPLACLRDVPDQELPFDVEKRLWLMLAASSDDLTPVLRGAVRLSRVGTSEARKAAAEVLHHVRETGLEMLVPELQAAAVGPEGQECLGSLIHEITDWLASPSVVLQKAARHFLREFTLDNLLEQVRHWPTQMCKAMAEIVKVVDTDVSDTLSRQLQSPAPKRRLAALQATQLLECADQVSDVLMPLMEDPRLEVRVRVIDLLSALGFEPLEEIIPELLNDASSDIQDAADRAVRRMRRTRKAVPKV